MRGEYGACASKSALSAAARGQRLPNWETAWEFVRVLAVDMLGRDPADAEREWRARWEHARDQLAERSDADSGGDSDRDDGSARPGVADRPKRLRRPIAMFGSAAVAILLAGGALLFFSPGDPPTGDRSDFVADVTVPDGSEVRANFRFVKTWELRNAGTIGWIGRYLKRSGSFGSPDECLTPALVPVPATQPGDNVRISVEVQAPQVPGYCQVYWKMVDERGKLLLPDNRAVFLSVKVVP